MCERRSGKILRCEYIHKIPEMLKVEMKTGNEKYTNLGERCQCPSKTSTLGKKQLLRFSFLIQGKIPFVGTQKLLNNISGGKLNLLLVKFTL